MKTMFALLFVSVACVSGCGSDDDGGGSGGAGTGGAGTGATSGSGGAAGAGATSSGGTAGAGATGSGGTAGSSGSSGASGSGGATACNSLTNGGAFIPETAGVGTFPTPAGGSTADGIYELTKFEIFPPGSVDPHKRKQTIKLAGNQVEFVNHQEGEAEERGAGTFATSGTELSVNFTCPGAQSLKLGYTATASTLVLFEIGSGKNEAHTFTKK